MDINIENDDNNYKLYLYRYIYFIINYDSRFDNIDRTEQQYVEVIHDFSNNYENTSSSYTTITFNYNSLHELHSEYDIENKCYIQAIILEDTSSTLFCVYLFNGQIKDIHHPVYVHGYKDFDDQTDPEAYYIYNVHYYSSYRITNSYPMSYNIYCDAPDDHQSNEEENDYTYGYMDNVYINSYNNTFNMDFDDYVPIFSKATSNKIYNGNSSNIIYEQEIMNVFNTNMLGKLDTHNYKIICDKYNMYNTHTLYKLKFVD